MITKEQVYEALHECYDPEIPVNIVDLGLVYDVQVDDGDNVAVKMTLTAPGCGMGTMIAADAKQRFLPWKASATPLSILSGIRPGIPA